MHLQPVNGPINAGQISNSAPPIFTPLPFTLPNALPNALPTALPSALNERIKSFRAQDNAAQTRSKRFYPEPPPPPIRRSELSCFTGRHVTDEQGVSRLELDSVPCPKPATPAPKPEEKKMCSRVVGMPSRLQPPHMWRTEQYPCDPPKKGWCTIL